ncbi:MAG: acyl-CoA dehydrogenase, partial [Pseudomonadota bacterium]
MSDYVPPLQDMLAALRSSANLDGLLSLPAFADCDLELTESVLTEAGKLASEVVAPLNQIGDRQGSVLENGVVRTPDGWRDAYGHFVDGGWNGLSHPTDHGGQGLPQVLAMAVQEMLHGANMAFGLCPLLNQGAVEL